MKWYRKAADKDHAGATLQLMVFEAVLRLDRDVVPDLAVSKAWAEEQSMHLEQDWRDCPLVPFEWEDIVPGDSRAIPALTLIHEALVQQNDGQEDLNAIRCSALRAAPVPFYPGHTLVELQCESGVGKSPQTKIVSAVSSSTGAVLLTGNSGVIHTINKTRIDLSNGNIASQYLSFFCSYVHGDEGPFFLPDCLGAISVDGDHEDVLPKEVRECDFSLRPMDGDLRRDAYQNFEATVLYADALFAATFKVHANGMVDMLNDQPILKDLPVMRRAFDGPWRTPPQALDSLD